MIEAQAKLRVVKLKLKFTAKKKGISSDQDDGDEEYCDLQLIVAEAEHDVASLEVKLKAAEKKEARRIGTL